jgi:hypothetical protein
VGQQAIFGPAAPGDITAIGTMNIARDGTIAGEFDVTVAEFGFFPDNAYTGSVTVNPNCTGTWTFTTSIGTSRADSIVVAGRDEIWIMSRDILNLWTGKARRIFQLRGEDD